MFDGQEHVPKLLPCSHTICLECLTRCPTINHLTNATTNYLNHINHLNHPNATINPPTDPDLNVTPPGLSPPLLATHSSGVLSAES